MIVERQLTQSLFCIQQEEFQLCCQPNDNVYVARGLDLSRFFCHNPCGYVMWAPAHYPLVFCIRELKTILHKIILL